MAPRVVHCIALHCLLRDEKIAFNTIQTGTAEATRNLRETYPPPHESNEVERSTSSTASDSCEAASISTWAMQSFIKK